MGTENVAGSVDPALVAAGDDFVAKYAAAEGGGDADDGDAGADAGADAAAAVVAGSAQAAKPVVAAAAQADPAADAAALDRAARAEAAALARLQMQQRRERQEFKGREEAAVKAAETRIAKALDSADPYAALMSLGFDDDRARMMATRLAVRYMPKDEKDPALQSKLAQLTAEQRIAQLEARLDREALERKQEAENAQKEAAARDQHSKAVNALMDVMTGAGDDLSQIRQRARSERGKQRLLQDMWALGQEMYAAGEMTSNMDEKALARAIAKRLNAEYAEEFGAPAQQAGAANGATRKNDNAGNVGPARTISRGASGATRPAPNGHAEGLSDQELLNKLASEPWPGDARS